MAHAPRPLARLLCWLAVAWLMALGTPPTLAQGRPASSDAAPTAAADKPGDNGTPLPQVDALRKQLDAIPLKLGEPDDGRKLLADINAIGQAA